MESRLSFVEETIGISPSTSASQISSNANISKRLAVISNALKEIETKGLHDIASNYYKANELLEMNKSDKSSSLSLRTKAELILVCEEELENTMKLLEQVSKLSTEIQDLTTLQNVVSKSSSLYQLESLHFDQQLSATELSQNVSNLLLAYNEKIENLSEIFIYWDSLLYQLEQEVNKLLREAGQ